MIIKPLGPWAETADRLLLPLMRFVLNAPGEEPQRTHWWNHGRLTDDEVVRLEKDYMAQHAGDPTAHRLVSPFIHLTRWGGWKQYAVLEPVGYSSVWNLGWIAGHKHDVSLIGVFGNARALIGPGPVSFFGIGSNGEQITLRLVRTGWIGDSSADTQLPLF